jgi:hypothetical protein
VELADGLGLALPAGRLGDGLGLALGEGPLLAGVGEGAAGGGEADEDEAGAGEAFGEADVVDRCGLAAGDAVPGVSPVGVSVPGALLPAEKTCVPPCR